MKKDKLDSFDKVLIVFNQLIKELNNLNERVRILEAESDSIALNNL